MGYLLLANSYEKQQQNKKKRNVVVLYIFLFTSRDCVGFNANANCRWSILKRPHTIHNESRLKWNFDAIRFDWPSCFFFFVFPTAWHLLKDRGKCVLSVRKRIWYFPFSRCMHINFVRQRPRDGWLISDIGNEVERHLMFNTMYTSLWNCTIPFDLNSAYDYWAWYRFHTKLQYRYISWKLMKKTNSIFAWFEFRNRFLS